jgi:hypothetical protein
MGGQMPDSVRKPWHDTVSPVVWKTLRETQCDVAILMEFLTQASDRRLQAHFDDTRISLTNPPAKIAAPPCKTYHEFLTRLAAIEVGLTSRDAPEPDVPATDGEPNGLANIPFLYWSRDFLAIVAAPATADSISITRLYVQSRVRKRSWSDMISRLFRGFGSAGRTAAATVHAPSSDSVAQRGQMAAWISRLVWTRELLAFWLAILVVALSTYSISGQLILKSRSAVIDQARDISRRIESAEKDLYLPTTAVQPPGQAGSNVAAFPVAKVIALCDLLYVKDPAASKEAANDGPFLRKYQSVAQINLCAERQRNLNEGIAIAAQVLSWLQWLRRLEFIGAPDVFGDDQGVTKRMGDNPFLCYLVTHRVIDGTGEPASGAGAGDSAGAGSKAKRSVCGEFQDILEYYGRVPEAVLQCLSLYILPSLYGALGAVLSTIRYVRGRVAGSMLTYIDRGRIQQDWLLGLVLGAVIGLFADYVAKANPVEGIALSALALLAGYNVSAVFTLFEDLSNRIFAQSTENRTQNTSGGAGSGGQSR